MALKFSELLDTQRLRPLWRRVTPDANKPAGPAESNQVESGAEESGTDLGEPQIPIELPHVVLAELEQNLRSHLGTSSALLGNLLHPLRAAVAKVDPRASERARSIPALIDRLDDVLTALTTPRQRH